MASCYPPEIGRYSEGDHEVRHRQQQIPLPLQPLFCCPILAFGAMAVLAGVIAVQGLVAILTIVNMTAKGLRPALFNRLQSPAGG